MYKSAGEASLTPTINNAKTQQTKQFVVGARLASPEIAVYF